MMGNDGQPADLAFYHLGRIIAVLELGARAHGEIRWVHRYYLAGFMPQAGLREPLQRHGQSVVPRLERKGTAESYRTTLDELAAALQATGGQPPAYASFDSWAAQVLQDKHQEARVPASPEPGDAVLYAEGYLEQRSALQPGRASPAGEKLSREYLWHYHLGRTMPWNGAGNDPRLPPGFQQGLKDKWAVTPDKTNGMKSNHGLRQAPPRR